MRSLSGNCEECFGFARTIRTKAASVDLTRLIATYVAHIRWLALIWPRPASLRHSSRAIYRNRSHSLQEMPFIARSFSCGYEMAFPIDKCFPIVAVAVHIGSIKQCAAICSMCVRCRLVRIIYAN